MVVYCEVLAKGINTPYAQNVKILLPLYKLTTVVYGNCFFFPLPSHSALFNVSIVKSIFCLCVCNLYILSTFTYCGSVHNKTVESADCINRIDLQAGQRIITWKGCRNKWNWPNMTCRSSVCLGGLRSYTAEPAYG
jgi:hypothetical protein